MSGIVPDSLITAYFDTVASGDKRYIRLPMSVLITGMSFGVASLSNGTITMSVYRQVGEEDLILYEADAPWPASVSTIHRTIFNANQWGSANLLTTDDYLVVEATFGGSAPTGIIVSISYTGTWH